MGKVFTGASMSLDGYISGPGESGFEHLFAWYNSGDVEVATTKADMTWRLSEASAKHVREMFDSCGAIVVGRKLFDLTNGWDGEHPLGCPVIVMTHRPPTDWNYPDAPFTFVTDGVESAVAQAKQLAGGKGVGVNGGNIATQCLEADLLDEIWVELVPVLLGGGVRLFDQFDGGAVTLSGPTVSEGVGVTHLRYRVNGK